MNAIMKSLKLPGATIEVVLAPGVADRQLTPLFSCGGLVLSQVCQLSGLEGYTVQNWIKRKILTPPVKKKYSRYQLCRIFNINVLKDTFTLEQASTLLGCINGNLNNTIDGVIDDSRLYTYLVDCLAELNYSDLIDLNRIGETVRAVTADYCNSHQGSEIRLRMVLEIMLTACQAQQIHHRALEMFRRMDNM